jgi:predicted SAM-dependent methyltransferase
MKVEFDNSDPGYYESILQLTREALENNHPEAGSCDALLVDEGQDFRDDMLKILLALLRPGGDLVIALDPYQDREYLEVDWDRGPGHPPAPESLPQHPEDRAIRPTVHRGEKPRRSSNGALPE